MRSCEFAKPAKKGKTKAIRLGGVKFFTKNYQVVDHDDPNLLRRAAFVWILFEEQKNAEKCEARTQERSVDTKLCPVRSFAQAVQRVRKFVPGADGNTPICSIRCRPVYKSNFITNTYTLKLLREKCALGGGRKTFGFDPKEIGNKSICSGAAMSLLLTRLSSDEVMILGRWKSKAFLDYVRPQVVELTTGYSKDMVSFDTFFELCSRSIAAGKIQNHYKSTTTCQDSTWASHI